jgi:hypothetical protein
MCAKKILTRHLPGGPPSLDMIDPGSPAVNFVALSKALIPTALDVDL